MKPDKILSQARRDGVIISTDGVGKIKLAGNQAAVETWLPVVVENKQALLKLIKEDREKLSIVPALCRNCKQFGTIIFLGERISGCVRQLEDGPWLEEWKRLPADLKRCIVH